VGDDEMATGYYIVKLDQQNSATDRKIVEWTRRNGTVQDDPRDVTVAVRCQWGGWVTFSNSVFQGQVIQRGSQVPSFVNLQWDPPGDDPLVAGPSQHTYFDNQPLSSRDEGYQQTVVNCFAHFVLANYLSARYYIIEPIPDIVAMFDDHVPSTEEDVVRLICQRPDLMPYVRIHDEVFSADQLSPAARQFCIAVLESRESLENYLNNPAGFMEGLQADMKPLEVEVFQRAAKEKADAVLRAFDNAELGRARGDGNTYILMAVDLDKNLPDPRSLEWTLNQLPIFVEQNGFLPAFGCFVTQAQLNFHVVLAPNVGDRERDFLMFYGSRIIDRRDGNPIGRIGDNG
jgi:hypothetical protein